MADIKIRVANQDVPINNISESEGTVQGNELNLRNEVNS